MSKLEPRIEAVRKQFDLASDDFWQIPQNKQWVCKHAALEVVATKANVEWSLPQIIQADTGNGIAVMAVSGKMGSRIEWATGEASPKNNKNNYPWAMAEKRAKDRVVLKLVGIHGLVYSEDEGDFDQPEPRREVASQNDAYWGARHAMRDALVLKDVQALFATAWKATADEDLREQLQAEYEAKKADLANYVAPKFDQMEAAE